MKAFLEEQASLKMRIIRCQPVPSRWRTFETRTDLNWKKVPFESAALNAVPSKKGVYCFFLGPTVDALPPVGFPLYVGRTDRTLKLRFREYLHEQDAPRGRVHVRTFLNVFEGELTFYYAEFNGSYEQLVKTERDLLDALMPAYSDSGYSAEVRAGIGAWQ